MGDAKPMNEAEGNARAGKEEIASGAEVLQAMLKTAKAFRMYLPNNPLRKKFIDEATEKMSAHLRRYGQFQLDVEQFTIYYGGTSIHENRDAKESIAFRLYSDGIRSLLFREGIRHDEISDFLDIVGQDRPADTDDDIVTLLWIKDFPHIVYLLAEDFLEADEGKGAMPTVTSQKVGIRKAYEVPPEASTQQAPRNIEPITTEQAAALQKETAAEEARDPLQEVLKVLASILAGETDLGMFREFLEIVENLIGNLLHAGRTGEVLRLIRYLQKLERSASVAPGKRELIRSDSGKYIPADAVLALQKVMEGAQDFPVEDLPDLFRYLGPRHMKEICELLGTIQQMKMRKAAISAVVEVGKGNPRVFYPFLRDQRWYLVRNIVLILNLLGDRQSLDAVAPLASHPDLRVRKEVFAYLLKHPDPRARTAVIGFLQDESPPLRIRTLQILAAAKFTPALKAVEEMIAAKDFAEKPVQEKYALYEALGALGGDSVVPQLQRMVMKRHWLNRFKEGEVVACAVAGLKKAHTPAALEALRQAEAKRKGGELETLIARALKEAEKDGGGPISSGEDA